MPCKSSTGKVYCSVCYDTLDPVALEPKPHATDSDDWDFSQFDDMEVEKDFSNINNALDSIYFNPQMDSNAPTMSLAKSASEGSIHGKPIVKLQEREKIAHTDSLLRPQTPTKLPSFDEFLRSTLNN